MRIKRSATVAVVGAVAAAVFVQAPAGAHEDGTMPVLSIDPSSGPVGTVINISGDSGEHCIGGKLNYVLVAGTSWDDAAGFINVGATTAGADGSWSGQLEVLPERVGVDGAGPATPATPGTDYFVSAVCEVEATEAAPAPGTAAAAVEAAEDAASTLTGPHDEHGHESPSSTTAPSTTAPPTTAPSTTAPPTTQPQPEPKVLMWEPAPFEITASVNPSGSPTTVTPSAQPAVAVAGDPTYTG